MLPIFPCAGRSVTSSVRSLHYSPAKYHPRSFIKVPSDSRVHLLLRSFPATPFLLTTHAHSPIRWHRGFTSSSPNTTPASASVTSKTKTKSQPTSTVPKVDEIKQQRRQDWEIMRRLLPNLWPKDDWGIKARVVIAMSFLVGGKLLNVQVPFFFKSIIDSLNIPIDVSTSTGLWEVAGTVIVGYGLARIFSNLFSELRNAVFANVAQGAIRRVARNVFSHLLRLDIGFHLQRQTGGLTRALDRGTKGISFLLTSTLFHIVPTILEISMVCGILGYNFGYSFSGIVIGTMAAYSWFTIRTTTWRTKFRKEANKADNRAATVSVDSLINYEAVKIFNNEAFEVNQYDRALKDYERASVKIATSLAFLNNGQNIIFSSALTLVMWMGAKGVMAGTMTIGDLVMMNQLIFQLSLPLNFLGTVYRELRQSLIDMGTLFNLESEKLKIEDSPNAQPLTLTRGPEITFKNVSFGYHPSRPIFKDISFTIPQGKKVAIVGPSGCGKSTIFRLLFRFYDIQNGSILIDGKDIRSITLESLRKSIGVVPQDTPLFHSDIIHNIRYGRLDASDEEVKRVAKLARVDATVEQLPDRWSTKVGERGLMISGGEKQRLAIARVLLKDPEILFFDEATSALDTKTEAELMENIRTTMLGGGKTSIFIAHRLKTVVDSDLIIVLKDGCVAEQGSHVELMRIPNGVYQNLWEMQNLTGNGSPEPEDVTEELEKSVERKE